MKKPFLIFVFACFAFTAQCQDVFTYIADFTQVPFYGFADSAGNTKTPGKYNFIGKPVSGICMVWNGQKLANDYNGIYKGFVFPDGRELVAPKYFDARNFSDGMAEVALTPGQWGYINTKGKLVIPMKYIEARPFASGMAAVSLGRNEWSYIDKTGKVVIAGPFTRADTLSEGLAVVEVPYDMGSGVMSRHMGYIDPKGTMVIPAAYTYAQPFRNGIAIVIMNESKPVYKNYSSLIDKTGKRLTAKEYTEIRNHNVPGYYLCKLSKPGEPDKYEVVDRTGKEVPQEGPNAPVTFSDGLARVVKNGKWGYMDKSGTMIIPHQYASALDFSEGLAAAKSDAAGMYGFINKKGEWVVQPTYFSAGGFHDGLSVVVMAKSLFDPAKKYGAIDKTGKIVIPFEYTNIEDFTNGRALAGQGGFGFYLYKNGKTSLASDQTTLYETRRARMIIDKGDFATAAEILKKLEDKNYPVAQYIYGVILHQAPPPIQDVKKGMLLITKAADAGDATACNTLGMIYEKGMGVTADAAKAAVYYKKGADAGEPEAMYKLALLYRDGRGVAKNPAMFNSLIARSAQKAFPAAVAIEDASTK